MVLATVGAGLKFASREDDDRAVSARAQATAPDEARFQKVLLEGPLQQPMRIAVAPDRRVLFIERTGELKVWSPKTEKTTTAGRVRTATVGESGLIGLALAPDFARTGHIYLNYARADYAKKFIARVSRFTLGRDNKLDKASETKIIDVQHPVGYEGGHDAGDLLMTPEGNLFIATGDNTSCCKSGGYPGLDERPGEKFGDAQRTASNTNSPIGKILRITPKPEGGYGIPAGNLFDEANDPGDKTLPEIYAMGFRNPFQLGDYDPATGALWMADYGPDAVIADPERGPAGHVNRAPDHQARLLRLALLHDGQPALQPLELRHRSTRRVLRLRRAEEQVTQQHRARRPPTRAARADLLHLHAEQAVPLALRRRRARGPDVPV